MPERSELIPFHPSGTGSFVGRAESCQLSDLKVANEKPRLNKEATAQNAHYTLSSTTYD